MKYIFLATFALALLVNINAKSCETAADCEFDECCHNYGVTKSCSELQSEGQGCDGKFLCGCKFGFICKDREESVWNTFKVGTGVCTSAVDEIKGIFV